MTDTTTTRVGDVYITIEQRLKEGVIVGPRDRLRLLGSDDFVLRTADGKYLWAKDPLNG